MSGGLDRTSKLFILDGRQGREEPRGQEGRAGGGREAVVDLHYRYLLVQHYTPTFITPESNTDYLFA